MNPFRKLCRLWPLLAVLALSPACTFVDKALQPADPMPSALGVDDVFSKSAADRPAPEPAAPGSETDPIRDRDGAGGPAAPIMIACDGDGLPSYGEIGIIRFATPNSRFETPLRAAIARLRDLRPGLGFHLVLTIPESRAEAGSDADEVAARTRVEAVVFAILDMGVPARDVLFSGLVSAQASDYELRIFPVRICREQTAHAGERARRVDGGFGPALHFGVAVAER